MATTTNFGWETPDDTDLVKDGALAMRTLGNAIDTSLVDLKGGTTGQVLSKTSNTDMDFTWVTSDDANAIQNAIVDAKGDLIAASAADTPSRLAVGNNGETLVADSSATTGLRWQPTYASGKNVIINGNFDIWQRGTSFTGVANQSYNADRFLAILSGTGLNVTMSQDTSVPNVQSKYSLKMTQTASATSVSEFAVEQRLETQNVYQLFGKTVVASFWYRSNRTGNHYFRSYTAFQTGGTDAVTSFSVSAANTWEYKTVVISNFASVSAVSTSPTANGALFNIGLATFGSGASLSLSTNDYFQISQLQLEVGNVATAFTRAGGTLAGELAACRYYYKRNTSVSAYGSVLGTGSASGSTNIVAHFSDGPMRVNPTSVDYANVAVDDGATAIAITNVTISGNSSAAIQTINATVSGATQYRPYRINGNNNTNGYIGVSAEL